MIMAERPIGPHPVIFGEVPIYLSRGAVAWVDPEDYPALMQRRWNLGSDGYAVSHVRGARLSMHRMIARAPVSVLVDHKNGNPLDNRRRNLRRATPSQNSANRTRLLPHKSSRYRGVTLHRQTGRWQAAAKHRDRCVYLGLFDREEDAARAYDRKARELWGRFAVLNNPSARPAVAVAA